MSTASSSEIDVRPRLTDYDGLALSFAQERLWFLEQLHPGQPFNNLAAAFRLRGMLDQRALVESLSEVVRRHGVLRMTVRNVQGRPEPHIGPAQPLAVPAEDLSMLPYADCQARVGNLLAAEAQQRFDLNQEPLLRARLLRLAPDDHLLVTTVHRLAADPWSLEVLYREWTAFYEAVVRGCASAVDLPATYADFARRQRACMGDGTWDEQLEYWQQKLGDKLPVLDLPTDRQRPAVPRFHGAVRHFALRTDLQSSLETLAARNETSLSTLLLAAFQILLCRSSGQEDIVVGFPVSSRSRREIQGLIGPVANTLALRANLSGEPTIVAFLEQVRQTVAEAEARQDLPFEVLIEKLRADRDPSHSPLFQAAFNLRNAPPSTVELPGLSVSPILLDSGTAMVDLMLGFEASADGLRGRMEFNPDLFDPATILRMLGHLEVLLEGIVANPNETIGRLPLLTKSERHELLVEWNDTRTEYPASKCVHTLFEEQVQRTPDAVAVVFEDGQLTYRQLDEHANRLARKLKRMGVGPEVRVGICPLRSLEMMVGLYAIHKAGGAYVPMDPGYPPERLAFMLEDAEASVLLTHKALAETLPPTAVKLVFLDELLRSDGPANGEAADSEVDWTESNSSINVTSENLSHVIYTSGSTGKPKGVMVLHRNVVNLFTAMDPIMGREPGVLLAATSISFDLSVVELFWTLTRGYKVVLKGDEAVGRRLKALRGPKSQGAGDKYSLAELIFRHGVTHVQCTPSLAAMMFQDPKTLQAFRRIKKIHFGGEPLLPSLVQQLAGGGEIFNQYAPSETTTWSTFHSVTRHGGVISIGKPIANTEVYILDKYLQPVPVGVAGEIYIGGEGVARGYLNRPELTAERFLPDPFSERQGARIYRTGDIGRFKPDGSVEFLGRIDHQVKVRGFRIELGEIEAVMRQHPQVKEAAVSTWEAGPNDKRLVGYFVHKPGQVPATVELRRFIAVKLPDYMVPSVLIRLEALPLTPSGKVNRKALPAPRTQPLASESAVPAQAPLEKTIVTVWQDVLHVEQIGLEDNFFDLGGSPQLAAIAHASLCEWLDMSFPLIKLFQFPSAGALARALQAEYTERFLNTTTARGRRQRRAFALERNSESEFTL